MRRDCPHLGGSHHCSLLLVQLLGALWALSASTYLQTFPLVKENILRRRFFAEREVTNESGLDDDWNTRIPIDIIMVNKKMMMMMIMIDRANENTGMVVTVVMVVVVVGPLRKMRIQRFSAFTYQKILHRIQSMTHEFWVSIGRNRVPRPVNILPSGQSWRKKKRGQLCEACGMLWLMGSRKNINNHGLCCV